MIDCKITENYLREKGRMTRNCEILCNDCSISVYNNPHHTFCGVFDIYYLSEVIAIVQKWSDEHPVKTYKDVFLEKFPKAKISEDNNPVACVNSLWGKQNCDSKCDKCWNRPYEEEQEI